MKFEKNIIKILLILSLLSIFLMQSINAEENDYGIVDAWVKIKEQDWQDAGLTNVELKTYEPFWVKTTITTKVPTTLHLGIQEPGSIKAFETIEGPSESGTTDDIYLIHEYDNPAGWTKTYEWKLRPTGNWTSGTAPLNLKVFFIPEDTEYNKKDIEFVLINTYISKEKWEGSIDNNVINDNSQNNNGSDNTPGFETILILLAIISIVIISKFEYRKR